MNYIEWQNETPSPGLSDAGFRNLTSTQRDWKSAYQLLCASFEAVKAENANLKHRAEVAEGALRFLGAPIDDRNYIDLSLSALLSAVENAPPGVQDWLKAFGTYGSASATPTPAPEPQKPVDPRSEILSKGLHSNTHGNAPGYPPFDE